MAVSPLEGSNYDLTTQDNATYSQKKNGIRNSGKESASHLYIHDWLIEIYSFRISLESNGNCTFLF